jgi:nucleoside-diphosphate-sugar epimerase
MVQADLTRVREFAPALRNCDAVVHSAIGTNYGSRRDVFGVTVGGTKSLAEAARRVGVGRFVHLSTLAVHGNSVTGSVDESTPRRPDGGSDYSESKAAAEVAVERAVARGLPAVILRIANVYGPFNGTLVTRPLGHLLQGRLSIIGGDHKPSNTVYLDDVVGAILGALRADPTRVVGETFTIAAFDEMTWAEFYDRFARGLGVAGVQTPDPSALVPTVSGARRPIRWLKSWVDGATGLARSPEFRALARRVLESDPIGTGPRRLLETFPALDHRLRRAAGVDVAHVYHPEPRQAAVEGGMTMNPPNFLGRSYKAIRVLGYRPALTRDEAMETTLDWYGWWSRRPITTESTGMPELRMV